MRARGPTVSLNKLRVHCVVVVSLVGGTFFSLGLVTCRSGSGVWSLVVARVALKLSSGVRRCRDLRKGDSITLSAYDNNCMVRRERPMLLVIIDLATDCCPTAGLGRVKQHEVLHRQRQLLAP